jgi:biopolymer transport protein TolR
MARIRKRRKLTSEINVVPYIDVMLVLLIIFMVTAPLMNLGVDIQLPQSNAKPLEQREEPLLISVDKDGALFLTAGGDDREAIDADNLARKIGAFVAQNKKLQVLIAADETVPYGRVYEVMALMQQAGAPRVAFISQPKAQR